MNTNKPPLRPPPPPLDWDAFLQEAVGRVLGRDELPDFVREAADGGAAAVRDHGYLIKTAADWPEYLSGNQLVFWPESAAGGDAKVPPPDLDIWDKAVPVEKSSYLQDGAPVFLNADGVTVDSDKPCMIDLFCGAGGFSVGAAWSGFQTVFGIDHLEPAMDTWMANHPHALGCLGDIKKADPGKIRQMLLEKGVEHVDLLTGGVPCQGFSRANRKHNDSDERNFLFIEYMRFVREFKPDYIILENVSGMLSTAGGQFADRIKSEMEALGYIVSVRLLNAADYGVPQQRQRIVFVGVRNGNGMPCPYIFPKGAFAGKPRTVEDAISDLPPLGNDEESVQYHAAAGNEYQRLMRDGCGKLSNHRAPNHPQETIDKIAATRPGEPMYPKFQQRIRLRLDAPSPTQLAGGIRPQFQFGHPTQPRGLSIRERARIQSFPDSYVFRGGIVQERVQTGNAVPPLLIHELTKPMFDALMKRGR